MKTFQILFVFFILGKSGHAQNEFNQLVFSGGATNSLFRGVHKIPFNEYEKDFDFTIGKQVHIDWGLLRRVSLGLGFTSHKHELNIIDYSYSQNGIIYTENPTQKISVNTFYFRALIHMKSIYDNSDNQLDVYWGATQHFSYFRTSNNSNDPNFYKLDEQINRYLCFVAGVRYYPFEFTGFHAEAALPGPYTFSIGLTFRTGGRYDKPTWWKW